MRTGTECYDCILGDLQGALQLLPLPEVIRDGIAKEGETYLADEFGNHHVPSTLITGVHRILKRRTGLEIPFHELRKRCNQVGSEIAEQIQLENADKPELDRFRAYVLWSIAGNHLDFRTVGAGYRFSNAQIRQMLEEKVAHGLSIDHVDRIYQRLKHSKRVLYIPDNVGELAFDKLLISQLRMWGLHVAVPYRGGAITSDAILEDFETLGIADAASEIVCAGPDTLGVSWEEKSPELAAALQNHDVLISKGQANFYFMDEYKDRFPASIACLLCTKCDPVSKKFGLNGKVNIAAMLKEA